MHDVGNMYGRSNHEKNIKPIFDKVKTFLYDPMHQEWYSQNWTSTLWRNSIEQQIEDPTITIHDFVLYPRFLSALLRIADEMDEGRTKNRGKNY